MLAGDGQLTQLIARATQYRDTLLFKCIRNIAQFNPNCKETFEEHLEQYATMVQQCGDDTNLQIEIIGTLVYIVTDEWYNVIIKTRFVEFLQSILSNGESEDDIILEIVMLIATICRTQKISELIANSYLIPMLQELLGAKQEDDEMVQQILNTFFKLLFFKPTRDLVLH